jgi:hypothetical protein
LIQDENMLNDLEAAGATTPTGKKYYIITVNREAVYIPVEDFGGNASKAFARLGRRGIATRGELAKRIFVELKYVTDFPDVPIIESPGWTGPYFALRDGRVFAPDNVPPAVVVFDGIPVVQSESGTLDEWNEVVTSCVADHPILVFMLAAGFATPFIPLLPHYQDALIELVGSTCIGKSTAQKLLASVTGDPGKAFESMYTMVSAAQKPGRRRGYPTLTDDVDICMAGESPGSRAKLLKGLLRQDLDTNEGDNRDGYNVFNLTLLSASKPIVEIAGPSPDLGDLARARIMTIAVPATNIHGVFDSLPAGCRDAATFANELANAANSQHGTAYPVFIAALVAARSADQDNLIAQLNRFIRQFINKAAPASGDSVAHRRAYTFGLVYAAGRIARNVGVFDTAAHIGEAVLACYRMSPSAPAKQTIEQVLFDVAHNPKTMRLVANDLPASSKQVALANTFLWINGNNIELLVRPRHIKTIFADWTTLRKTQKVLILIGADENRYTVKRTLLNNSRPERVIRFSLDKHMIQIEPVTSA